MALVLPATVEELNSLQNSFETASPTTMYVKESVQGFENIATEKKFKREYSLPNGVENWNISNFDSYLNFEDNVIITDFGIQSSDDRLVPEGVQRQRCESYSSVSSSVEEKHMMYNSGVKTFSTVCMDSGSTCISSDHSYVHPNVTFKGLDAEETYQNLDLFIQQVPDFNQADTMSSTISSVPSPGNISLQGSCSQDDVSEKSFALKRHAEVSSEDEIFIMKSSKRLCDNGDDRYCEIRRKNNIASKNCRKTRKEKQKEMEIRVAELEKEKDTLKAQVGLLEGLIQTNKMKLYAILQKR